MNKEEFVRRAMLIHGNKYDYTKFKYVNYRTKVCITCPIHGDFWQLIENHLNKGCGCNKCGCERTNIKQSQSLESFIEKSKKVHADKYDYSKVKYKNNREVVEIICKKHGSFFQTPHNHLCGSGCPKCKGEECSERISLTLKDFIERASEIHNKRYDYSLIKDINSNSKVSIICPKHGIFQQDKHSHLKGVGCPMCKSSHGERKVTYFLQKNNIEYIPQYKIVNENIFCKNRELRVDFFLPKRNTIIEYEGEQHYKPVDIFGGEEKFTAQNERDYSLRQYCKEHKIKLIEIPYYEKDIDSILRDRLK